MDYDIEQYTWDDVRERVSLVNPKLAEVIDQINPDTSYKLYSINYKYGQIIDDGSFFLPEKQSFNTTKFTDAKLNTEIKSDLLYANGSIPAGVILNGALEIFIDSGNNIMPRFIYKPGDSFALWRKMDSENKSSFHPLNLMKISSGARSIFTLPNIGDYRFHSHLVRDCGINTNPPRVLKEHWETFRKLSYQSGIDSYWETNLLLFSKKWVDKLHSNDSSWALFKNLIYERLWSQTGYWRNKMFVDFAFSYALAKNNLKPNPYLNDTLKHIISIVAGESPGFKLAIDDSLAPVKAIQDIYKEIYKLKNYFPLIIQPDYFCLDDLGGKESIYYSLQFPTTYEFSPKSRSQATILSNIRELAHISQSILYYISNEMHQYANTALVKILSNCTLRYYHSSEKNYAEVRHTMDLLNDDASLQEFKLTEKEFCYNGTFIRGCVKIAHK